MKKLLSILLVIVMSLGIFSVTGFAASGIDANEEKVLSTLRQSLTIPNTDVKYIIPEKYVIQAENFFNQYEGLSEEDANTIISYLEQAAERFLTEADVILESDSAEFNLRALSYETKTFILEIAQKACELVGLKLVYENNVVTITGADGTVFFSNRPVVKKTGLLDGSLIYAVGGVAVIILAAAAGVYVWTKKRNGVVAA